MWIGGVLLLGMMQMWISYADLEYGNSDKGKGYRSDSLMIAAKIFYASKNTVARLLVLIVSMGYGIVLPQLGEHFKQIVAIGLSYFFFAVAFGITHARGQDYHEQ
eukprot:UC4_evm1s77